MSIRFIYFDLGNVLLNFSVRRLLHQISAATDIGEEEVREVIFSKKRYFQLESGELTPQDFFQHITRDFGKSIDQELFIASANDIFWVNDSLLPFARKLSKTFFPRGVLSNTNFFHWEYVQEAFPCIWELFPKHHVASYLVHSVKPYPQIYQSALDEARTEIPSLQPNEILLVDDLEENIQGAKEFGFQGVQYKGVQQLLDDLSRFSIPVPHVK